MECSPPSKENPKDTNEVMDDSSSKQSLTFSDLNDYDFDHDPENTEINKKEPELVWKGIVGEKADECFITDAESEMTVLLYELMYLHAGLKTKLETQQAFGELSPTDKYRLTRQECENCIVQKDILK